MNSRFYYRMTYRGNGTTVPVTIDAPFVTNLSAKIRQLGSLVVLADDEGNAVQGLHLWVNDRWRPALPQVDVSLGVVVGYDIDVYFDLAAPIPVDPGTRVFRNGATYTGSEMTADGKFIWVVMTPASGSGTVRSINNEGPDSNGNVTLGISNIPGLQEALDNAGQVKTVNDVEPDTDGNVELAAADVGAIAITVVGAANGVASLDTNGWIPMSQLPPGIIGGLQYQGAYDAVTDTPPLPAPSADNKGHYWVVSVAGYQMGMELRVGDWIVSNGTSYDKIDNQEGRVLSVNGAVPDASTGNVVVPVATATVAGTVVPGVGLSVDGTGTIGISDDVLGQLTFTPDNVLFVAKNGNPTSGDGSRNNPFTTINAAVAAATDGTAIVIEDPSVYEETLTVGDKKLALIGVEGSQDYLPTVLRGALTVDATQPLVFVNIKLEANTAGSALLVSRVGHVDGVRMRNCMITASSASTALTTNTDTGAWVGQLVLEDFYTTDGAWQIDGGDVVLRRSTRSSNSVVNVTAGVFDASGVARFLRVNHAGGAVYLEDVATVGSSIASPAIESTASGVGDYLRLRNISTWVSDTVQSFVRKIGTCPYVVDGLTRNLTLDSWLGTESSFKSAYDLDTVVTRAGQNYTGNAGQLLVSHLGGIDSALGSRLEAIGSSTGGSTLVADGDAGILKVLAPGDGIDIQSTATVITLSNSGILAVEDNVGEGVSVVLSSVAGNVLVRKLIQGNNVTIEEDEEGNLVIGATGGGGSGNISSVTGAGGGVSLIVDDGAASGTAIISDIVPGTGLSATKDGTTGNVTIGIAENAVVSAVNAVAGAISLIEGEDIQITTQPDGSITIAYVGSAAGTRVASLNGLNMDVQLVSTTPGNLDITTEDQSINFSLVDVVLSVVNATVENPGAAQLVATARDAEGNAIVRQFIPGANVQFIQDDTSITVNVPVGGGTVKMVNNVEPDNADTGNVTLEPADIGAVNVLGDQMQGALDMNDNRLVGLPIPTSENEPITLAYLSGGNLIIDNGLVG